MHLKVSEALISTMSASSSFVSCKPIISWVHSNSLNSGIVNLLCRPQTFRDKILIRFIVFVFDFVTFSCRLDVCVVCGLLAHTGS